MQLEHSFTVPAPVEEAWTVLRDVERIAPCMPGATIEAVEGEHFRGRVKVKVGPITVTYRGEARFVELNEATRTATVVAKGKETRGSGTANATVTARLTGRDGLTDVVMTTELAVTGKPAQFGRGVMADVGGKLVGQFAACLAEELAVSEPALVPPPAPAPEPAPAGEPTAQHEAPPAPEHEAPPAPERAAPPAPRPRPTADAIDLFDVARAPVAKRVAPAAAALAVLALVVWLIRRR